MNIINNNYTELKQYYDTVLNKNKDTFYTSNDEPTPMDCVEEMIGKIHTELFQKPNLKILDPCCGNGNFHLGLIPHLKPYYTMDTILNRILYFNDTNQLRIDNVNSIFNSPKNISTMDFLCMDTENKFDLIVANPPYASILENGKRSSKNHNLIKKFLDKSLSLVKEDGYILFITPNNWMSLADRNIIIKQLTKLQFLYLNIGCAKKYFPKIGSSFTWHVIQNTVGINDFVVEGIWKKKLYTSLAPSRELSFIPLIYTKEVYNILCKTINNQNISANLPAAKRIDYFPVETTSHLHKHTKKEFIVPTKDEQHPYKLIHTPTQTVYSSIPHKYQEGYKVFISLTNKYKVFIDDCGMTQSIAFIRCDTLDEAERIQKILQHDLYVFLNNICRWGNFNNVRILQKFPIPVDNTKDIYGNFGLLDDEIKFIEINI